MALISCPNCNKQISDTCTKCIHCGYILTQPQTPEKPETAEELNYHKLTSPEQENLRTEFYALFPKYGEYKNKQDKFYKSINIIRYISFFGLACFLIILLAGRIYHSVTKNDVPMVWIIVLLVAIAVWIIAGLICWFLILVPSKKYKRNELIVEKKFQRWLREDKHMVYTVMFTKNMKKYKQFFDSIDVDRQDIE